MFGIFRRFCDWCIGTPPSKATPAKSKQRTKKRAKPKAKLRKPKA